ncbi:MAG: CoA-binding protein [Dehalococcoidia bacterium]|nr:CoA-binding protein [Dehalococcoidia bacterium]
MRTIEEILKSSKTVAVVGLSPRPDRPSYEVARYLQEHGYRIIPVNPQATEVLGEKSYPSLADVPVPVDVVDIFRRSEDVPPIVDEAVMVKARVVWMQEGIVNQQAAATARRAGLDVVMDRCMQKEHKRLAAPGKP